MSGHFTQAAAANENMMVYHGQGFEFDLPLEIPGGTPFKVTLHQGNVLATASQAIVCALHGTLTTS